MQYSKQGKNFTSFNTDTSIIFPILYRVCPRRVQNLWPRDIASRNHFHRGQHHRSQHNHLYMAPIWPSEYWTRAHHQTVYCLYGLHSRSRDGPLDLPGGPIFHPWLGYLFECALSLFDWQNHVGSSRPCRASSRRSSFHKGGTSVTVGFPVQEISRARARYCTVRANQQTISIQ